MRSCELRRKFVTPTSWPMSPQRGCLIDLVPSGSRFAGRTTRKSPYAGAPRGFRRRDAIRRGSSRMSNRRSRQQMLQWEFANSAVAAHRDSFFRPLADVKLGDRLILTTSHGKFGYAVSKVRVVDPDDVSVLAQTGHSSLTLVTCYPFRYVGRAPKR